MRALFVGDEGNVGDDFEVIAHRPRGAVFVLAFDSAQDRLVGLDRAGGPAGT